MVSKRALYLGLLLISPFTLAENLATPASKDFSEHFSSNVPVSGNILVGALYSNTKITDQFYLDATNDTAHFCFKVSSIDGTYVSENDYLMQLEEENAENESIVSIQYPTRFSEIISGFSVNQLAPLATKGNCNNQRNATVLLATRNTDIDNASVLFMVSSGRSEVFMFLKAPTGKRVQVKCHRLEEGKRTAYDTICEIPAGALSEDTYQGSIVRRKNGSNKRPVMFTLLK